MAEWIDNKIKGNIAETIIEDLFEKLGFYVFKIGQENTINPITHLQRFIQLCGGKFKLEDNAFMDFGELTYLKKLPDFVIIDKNGRVDFIEVKFRNSGVVNKEHLECLSLYPCKLLTVNTEITTEKLLYGEENPLENIEDLKKSRFHIWLKDKEAIIQQESEESIETHCGVIGYTLTLQEWLKLEFGIENKELIEKYSELVTKWLTGSHISSLD